MDLSMVAAVDQHAHNVLRAELDDADVFVRAFTEAHDPRAVAQARNTLFYRRSLRDLAGLLGCAATESAILTRRWELGLEALMQRCLGAAHLEMLLLDDGFLPEKILPTAWHAQFVPVRRLLRIERLAEELLSEGGDFSEFEDRFRAQIESPGTDVVGYKSIACYRSGLDIQLVSRDEARAAFASVIPSRRGDHVRLTNKALVDHLLVVTLEVAARRAIPVQLHTGFGDPDLDLRLANPLHLRRVLEHPITREAPLVLLHAGYPFVREAGYLASVYPQVHVDCGLAVPFLSVAGMRDVVGQLLELAPWSRLLYSSDAHFLPELFYLGARHGRRVICECVEEAIRDGDLAMAEGETAARAILVDNARGLYHLGGDRR
jgi:predicted TIM-barrel fold metal-dependent hydrolase